MDQILVTRNFFLPLTYKFCEIFPLINGRWKYIMSAKKYVGVFAASAFFLVVSPPVYAVTFHVGGPFDEIHGRQSTHNLQFLDNALAKIFSREDNDACGKKCSRKGEESSGGGGLGREASLESGSVALALLGSSFGFGDGAGAGGRFGHNNGFASNFQSDANPSDASNTSVSSAPLPSALPLFASGLAGLGLLRWLRKRRASQKPSLR
jgi:hypothetical protein